MGGGGGRVTSLFVLVFVGFCFCFSVFVRVFVLCCLFAQYMFFFK